MSHVLNTLMATTASLAFEATLAAAFVVLGLSARRAFGLKRHDIEDVFQAFWMGFGGVLTVLLAANFWVPIGQTAFWILLGSAAAVWVVWIRKDEFALHPAPPRWALLAAAGFCLWVSNLSLGSMAYFDSALYHMQGVRWAHEYAIVPGLANLFGPLGFNNGSFVYNAMLNVGPWNGASWHVSNGVLVCVLGVQLLVTASRRHDRSIHGLFCLLLLPLAVDSALDNRVSSYGTVVPMTLLVAAVAVAISRAFDDGRTDNQRAFDLAVATALAASAVVVKSSAGVFALGVLAVAIWGLRTHVTAAAMRRKASTWAAVFVALTAAIWISRGIVLSGYPLFPSPVFGLPVDWRVPLEHARAEFDFVRHSSLGTAENYAFVAGKVQAFFVWFRPWVKSELYDLCDVVLPGLIVLSAGTVVLLRVSRRAGGLRACTWAIAFPALAAIAAWWAVAPMAHYGTAFFWILAASLGSAAIHGSQGARSRFARWLFALAISPVILTPAWPRILAGADVLTIVSSIASANIKQVPPGRWFQVTEDRTVRIPFTTTSGLVLQVPQGRFGRCWYSAVPCTPNPAPNLRLRVPGSIERGFAVDGNWQMIGWPEPWRAELLPAMREFWNKGRN